MRTLIVHNPVGEFAQERSLGTMNVWLYIKLDPAVINGAFQARTLKFVPP